MQGDERSFFGALRVAGHGTGSARSGVDIRHISKTDGPTFHVIRCPHRPCTHTVQLLCSYCTVPSEGLFLCSCRRRGCSHKRVGAFCRFGIMGFEIWKQERRRVR